jgi:hypothetical protein
MKNAARILALLTGLPALAFAQIVPCVPGNTDTQCGNLISVTGSAASATPTLDMAKYHGSRISAQLIYSSTTFAAATFTDGNESTGTVTIISTQPLVGAKATNKVTIASATGIAAMQLNANGTILSNFNLPTTSGTAHALAALLNVVPGIKASQTGTDSVVYATAATAGVAGNFLYLIPNSASMTVTATQFSGGQDNAVLTINGTALTQGTQWSVSANDLHLTAQALAAAVTTQFTVLTATVPGSAGAINITSNVNNLNYSVTTSTPAAMSAPPGGALAGGKAASTSVGSANIALTAHGFTTALAVLLSTSGQAVALPSPLVQQTTYYVIAAGPNVLQLSGTSTGAVAGLGTVITSSSAQSTADTFTLTALGLSSVIMTSATWQTSDDNVNFVSSGTTNISSTTSATDTLFDFGFLNYRYLRLKIVPASQGGVNVTVPVYIKQDGIGPF